MGFRGRYIPEAEYQKRFKNAKKFRPGEILPEEKVKYCPSCQTPYYITSGKNGGNYKARAVKTDAGFVAVPFEQAHEPSNRLNSGHFLWKNDDGSTQEVKTDCWKTQNEPGHREAQDKALLDSIKAPAPSAPATSDTAEPAQASVSAPTSTEKPKGFTNKYAGNCVDCGTRVGTGEGVTSRGAGGWEVRCVGCHHG
jgi:hypothetical protein